jgi:hypothetical protein
MMHVSLLAVTLRQNLCLSAEYILYYTLLLQSVLVKDLRNAILRFDDDHSEGGGIGCSVPVAVATSELVNVDMTVVVPFADAITSLVVVVVIIIVVVVVGGGGGGSGKL